MAPNERARATQVLVSVSICQGAISGSPNFSATARFQTKNKSDWLINRAVPPFQREYLHHLGSGLARCEDLRIPRGRHYAKLVSKDLGVAREKGMPQTRHQKKNQAREMSRAPYPFLKSRRPGPRCTAQGTTLIQTAGFSGAVPSPHFFRGSFSDKRKDPQAMGLFCPTG